MVTISSLRREVTEEEIAAEKRRRELLRDNRHPETGVHLRPQDECTLRPIDKIWLRMARTYRSLSGTMQRERFDQGLADMWRYDYRLDHLRNTELRAASGLMLSDHERLFTIYGARLESQTEFFLEQKKNLALFAPNLTSASFERSDLLARIALPLDFITGFERYQDENLKSLRQYAEALLSELEADFAPLKNPVFAWDALKVALQYGVEVPDWVLAVLESAAHEIGALRDAVQCGVPLGKEAQMVGRALGFGQNRPGSTGLFAQAVQIDRDREIYWAVTHWLEQERIRHPIQEPKLTSAYSEVAAELQSNPSTVGQAYRRMKEYIELPEESDE